MKTIWRSEAWKENVTTRYFPNIISARLCLLRARFARLSNTSKRLYITQGPTAYRYLHTRDANIQFKMHLYNLWCGFATMLFLNNDSIVVGTKCKSQCITLEIFCFDGELAVHILTSVSLTSDSGFAIQWFDCPRKKCSWTVRADIPNTRQSFYGVHNNWTVHCVYRFFCLQPFRPLLCLDTLTFPSVMSNY